MDTLRTNKKLTVILSAYQASNTPLQNLIDSEALYAFIEHEVHSHAIRAVGIYKGGHEQSFVIHTNSSSKMVLCRRYSFDVCHQECILVRNNRKHEIKLHGSDGFNTLIGEHFSQLPTAPKQDDYTILNGKDFYGVV